MISRYYSRRLVSAVQSQAADQSKIGITVLTDFLAACESCRDFYWRTLDTWIKKVIDDEEYDHLIMGRALWLLVIDREVAPSIRGEHSLESFRDYLHRMQNLDWSFATPRFFNFTRYGLVGVYIVISDVVSLFPLLPKVPFGVGNAQTKGPLEVDHWFAGFSVSNTAFNLPYEKFIAMFPQEKVSRYNSQYIKVEKMSADQWKQLFEEQKEFLI